jgi:integrase
MRRGELLGLQWRDVAGNKIKVERQLHQTKAGSSRFGPPKGKKGRRTITIPSETVDMLAEHRKQQLEIRMRFGMGKPAGDALVFSDHESRPIPPDNFSVSRSIGVELEMLPGFPRSGSTLCDILMPAR